jgi:hypothetical protein
MKGVPKNIAVRIAGSVEQSQWPDDEAFSWQ